MRIYNVDLQDYDGNSYRVLANADSVAEFTQAAKRENIASGETHKTIFGKIAKNLADLKGVAFTGSYADLADKPTIPAGAAADYPVANNDTTNNAGYLVTAKVAYQHGQEIDKLNSDLSAGLNGCKITYENGNFYGTYGNVKKKFNPAQYVGTIHNSMVGNGTLQCSISVPQGTFVVICARFDHYLPSGYTFGLSGYSAIATLYQHTDTVGYGAYVYGTYMVIMNAAGTLVLSGTGAQNDSAIRSQELTVIQIDE